MLGKFGIKTEILSTHISSLGNFPKIATIVQEFVFYEI